MRLVLLKRLIFKIIETEKALFLVMEYARNGELFEYIVKK